MSLPHILLGLLEQPASGYDIKQKFNRSLVHFWAAELSQIYPALKKLEDQYLLTSASVPSSKGPARKIYTRTNKGTDELLHWLAQGPDLGATRVPYLAQTYFLSSIGDLNKAIDFFTKLEHTITQRLNNLNHSRAEWAAHYPDFPETLCDADFIRYSTLEFGISMWEARLKWCLSCTHRLRARAA